MSNNYAGLPLDLESAETKIVVDSAIEWVRQNTTMEIAPDAELPANVKLFVLKYIEIMNASAIVASESLGGMSQSFNTNDKAGLIRQYAANLLAPYYSAVQFIPASRKW